MHTTGPIHSAWVLANGVRTHYASAGFEGPPVVLLHRGGPGASGELGWRLMIPALADAVRSRGVTTVDELRASRGGLWAYATQSWAREVVPRLRPG
jgi:pimeloyl-ACP methyl ester carboxylesterase